MDLREAVVRTVCYFDIFDCPLSRAEIGRWLYGNGDRTRFQPIEEKGPVPVSEVDAAINTLLGEKKLKEEGGLVFLAGRDGLAPVRAERKAFSERKWKRARRWARVFASLPGVELVGVGNTLAHDNAKDGSDIDFFIVTAPGCIWRTRFLCASFAAILDMRPKADDNRDKLCLSFFVTAEALDMRAFAIGGDDVYMRYWTRLLRPLYGDHRVYEKFRAVNPEAEPREMKRAPAVLRALFSPLASLPGSFMRGWQKRHFPNPLLAAEAKHDRSVIISDSALKLHVVDRRADIYRRWADKVKSVLP